MDGLVFVTMKYLNMLYYLIYSNHFLNIFFVFQVVWENVRCLKNGETVSVDGTHLGHNLPDRNGNRYCINLVSVAGYPADSNN